MSKRYESGQPIYLPFAIVDNTVTPPVPVDGGTPTLTLVKPDLTPVTYTPSHDGPAGSGLYHQVIPATDLNVLGPYKWKLAVTGSGAGVGYGAFEVFDPFQSVLAASTPDPFAQAVMVAYCGWDPTVPVVDGTVLLDGNGSRLVTLPSLHVTAVTAVTVTDQWGTVNTLTIGPGFTDVSWSENGCLTYKGHQYQGWPEDQQNVAVTYSGGYATIPAELDAVLASISKRAPSIGVQSKRLGTASITYNPQFQSSAGDLLVVEKMVLDRYRILKAA
jgi:hypothetical protein